MGFLKHLILKVQSMSQHYILDVVFNEDASRIVMDDAVEHMALFRRFVLNILKQSECCAPS